ncbi:uncharacterized protein LOC112563700 isoform X3 [Pomacea canaliculata]|uniref:uncharacterized protein LOC112563700 isoform X3 n=1 Tax=Pomacea canaliculata TaxID=400727 RepID=UPI000D72DF6F|nr:uncharacterized protein LOC112563700 isoform X3 [Pomacea canaliculata]
MASKKHIIENLAAEDMLCELCDFGNVASHHCDDCLVNLCDRCVDNVHRKLNRNGEHSLSKGVARYVMEFELCPNDGEKLTTFCRDCNVRLCHECDITAKLHSLHNTVGLKNYVVQEKEKLLGQLDDLTSKTARLSYYTCDIQSTALNIELKWLQYKELIKQEFASLLETILDRQQELLARMEQEVQKSLQDLRDLEAHYEEILSQTCDLSDELITAVQNLSKTEFLQSHGAFKNSCDKLEGQIQRLQSAADVIPAFLAVPFSLHQEKVHLDSCLQFGAFADSMEVKSRNSHQFIRPTKFTSFPAVQDLFITPSSLPPSTVIKYYTEIYTGGSRKEDTMYLVKVTPELVCNTHKGHEKLKGRTVTAMLLTCTDRNLYKKEEKFVLGERFTLTALKRSKRDAGKRATQQTKNEISKHVDTSTSLPRATEGQIESVLPVKDRHKIYTLPLIAETGTTFHSMEGILQTCKRFEKDSFEEGRVIEDKNLKFYEHL